jgi:hypothetical protein
MFRHRIMRRFTWGHTMAVVITVVITAEMVGIKFAILLIGRDC